MNFFRVYTTRVRQKRREGAGRRREYVGRGRLPVSRCHVSSREQREQRSRACVRACRNVCNCTNARLQRKAAVYQRPVDVLAAVCVLVRNAGRTVRCGAINSSVTPITRRVDRDVLSRENRNYPLSPSAAILRPTFPPRIALKFRIIAATFEPSSACFARRALLTRFRARLLEKEPLRVELRE